MEPDLRWFEYSHLPAVLQEASRPFHTLAAQLKLECLDSTERNVAVRKLLEAKDAAVRALLFTEEMNRKGLTAATFGQGGA